MQMSFVPNAQVIKIKLFSDHFFRIRRFFAVSMLDLIDSISFLWKNVNEYFKIIRSLLYNDWS